MSSPKGAQNNHMAAPVKVARQQTTPELSGTFRTLPPEPIHQHTPELSGTFRNLPPEPAPATRTGTHGSLSGLKTPLAYAVGEKKRGVLSLLFEFSGEFMNSCLLEYEHSQKSLNLQDLAALYPSFAKFRLHILKAEAWGLSSTGFYSTQTSKSGLGHTTVHVQNHQIIVEVLVLKAQKSRSCRFKTHFSFDFLI